MKVMVVGPLGADDFADNVQESLTSMGIQVVATGASRPQLPFRRLESAAEQIADRLSRVDKSWQGRLRVTVKHERPDLLLSMDRRVHRSVIQAARDVGTRTALWFPDHVANLGLHQMFLAGYDRIYIKNPVFVRRLQGIYGINARYLPEAANARWHRTTLPYGTRAVIVMAGNVHPTRALLLDRLLRDGVPVEIYGAPMPTWIDLPRVRAAHKGTYLARSHKADVFRSARAVLNNLHPGEFAGINCRVFEGAASGAVVLTEPREGLSDLFDLGREVEKFDSYDELLEKSAALLKSDQAGREIGDRAAARAHNDHTYEKRLASIFADLELP